MLTNRDDYYFYGGNAIKRIAIEGKPYPERSAKLVMLGEDEAYIQEAAAERKYEERSTPESFTDCILRIPWLGSRVGYPWSDWCWRQIYGLVHFLDVDKAEAFEVPSSPFLVWRATFGTAYDESYVDELEPLIKERNDLIDEQSRYQPGSADWERLQALIDAKNAEIKSLQDEMTAISDAETERQDELKRTMSKTVFEASSNCNDYAAAYRKAIYGDADTKGLATQLAEDLQEYEDDRIDAVREADSEYRSAKTAIDQTRSDDLEKAKKDYDEEVVDIDAEYAGDPPEGVDEAEWARRKALALWNAEVGYYDKCDEINSTWQSDSDKAKRDMDAAIVEAWQTYISDAKERWLSHIEEVNILRENFETDVNDENAARNREIESLLAESTDTGDFDRFGIPYAYGLVAIDESRRDMAIDFSCLDHYLRKTPVPGYHNLIFVAHAHSSDATIRMYADLEMRRCVDVLPIMTFDRPQLYRDAFDRTFTPSGAVNSYNEHVADEYPYTTIYGLYEQATTGGNDYSIQEIDSNTRFSIYFGRRHEVETDTVETIYATVAIYRAESTYRSRTGLAGYSKDENNYTYGYLRVKLENMGVQNASYLAELDKIDDDLAEDYADIDKEYAEARAEIEDTYYKALDARDRAYDEDIAKAAKERDKKMLDADDDFMASISPVAAACNSDLQSIDDDEDMDDAEKRQARNIVMDRFWRDWDNLYRVLSQTRLEARQEYSEKEAEAARKRSDATTTARNERTQAIRDLDDEMQVDERKAELRRDAQDAKDAVYARATALGITLRPDARCKWSFDARALDSDALVVPDFGDRGPYNDFVECSHSAYVYVDGLVHLDVVYAPKSETGMDYAPYMAEAKAGYERPRKYRPLKFFDYRWSDPVS